MEWERYTGKWYSIGRFPHRFERGLQNVTAEYSLNPDGSIQVINTGYKEDRQKKTAKARAVIQPETGVLKVYFVPVFGGEYRVLELDQDYQYALVGSSGPDYLWILSRTPQLPESTVQDLLAKAADRGYDLTLFERVIQNKGD